MRLHQGASRSNSKAFARARCKRRHHLAGICLKIITPTSTATAAPADESDLKVVRTVNVRAANSSNVASLLDGISEDPTITLRFGMDPDAEYCETPALVDTGANLSLMDQGVCDFLHRNGLVDGSNFSGFVSPAQVTFGNHTVVQTKTVLPIKCGLADHQSQDNANTASLVFLLVPLCNPRVIIGRNMFGRLGIRLKSDKVPLPPYLPPQSVATQTSNDVPVTSAEVSSPSSSAIISAHCCRASSFPTTPLIERIVEGGQHRLLARLPPVENALIYPYRASKRRRPPVDDAIIHEKLTQMCRLGMAAKSADKDVIVACQPGLIDKWDSSSGTSKPRTHPIDEAEVKSPYRLTIDSRPSNNLKLQCDSSHKTIIEEDINPALAAAGLKATVIHVKDVLISSSDIETGHKAWVIVSDILHRKGGFIFNGSKSQPPSRTASFCGLQLEGRTYEPTPSRREFTEATYNIALRDFIDCNPAKPKRSKKRPISTGDVFRDRRFQWLRSWCGVFNYLAGHLSPEAQSALNQLYTVTKVYQDSGSSAEDIDSTVPIVSSALRVLTDFYLSGFIPCAIGNDGIATLVVTDERRR
ncbi:hypothetical protein FOZ60_006247 [Perkinsus olseni]|uniref:Peptidase A2 domain-containing protein n=1 Tax=Perkinsus olseni TaxID=32597 RepID=A0A7J6NRJ8_PEROL|nr:hypothetical protein FOZ60_006247 [Perkinsus olseni]